MQNIIISYQENGFIVAEMNNEVVGFCRYTINNLFSQDVKDIDCELCAIYVKSDMKRQGIGAALFQYVIQEQKKNENQKMILWCLKENYNSRKFYEKWDDIDQKNRFKESMEKTFDRTYIIMFNNERIGFYQGQLVNDRTYFIENICIIPEYQGKGIGTKILQSKLKEYSDKNIEIQYFKQNPVGKLYKRLGFEPNGETEFHYQMIKRI